jgi:hypothetical protein
VCFYKYVHCGIVKHISRIPWPAACRGQLKDRGCDSVQLGQEYCKNRGEGGQLDVHSEWRNSDSRENAEKTWRRNHCLPLYPLRILHEAILDCNQVLAVRSQCLTNWNISFVIIDGCSYSQYLISVKSHRLRNIVMNNAENNVTANLSGRAV